MSSAFRFNRTRNALIALSIIAAITLTITVSSLGAALWYVSKTDLTEKQANRATFFYKASMKAFEAFEFAVIALLITLFVSSIRFAAMKK